jgi:hypothetical protein
MVYSREFKKGDLFIAVLVLSLTVANEAAADTYTNWGFPLPRPSPYFALTATPSTNGQIELSFLSPPALTCVVESSTDLINWTPFQTNFVSTRDPFATIDPTNNAEYFRAWRSPIPILTGAILTRGNLSLNGNGPATDSFNSADPNLSTNGLYDPTKTSTNGNVACEQGVVNLGNHTVNGNLHLGPDAAFVSSTNQVLGSIYYDAAVYIPDAALPNLTWWPAPVTNNVHDFTSDNTALFQTFFLNDSLSIQVEPGVTVILDVQSTNYAPASITILGGVTNSGTLVIYQESGSATLFGTGTGPGLRADSFWYFGLPQVTSVTLGGNTTFVGVIYAPEASLTLNGGGASNYFVGAFVIGTMVLNGHYMFHFDENLLKVGPVQ